MAAGRHQGQHGDDCFGCRIRTVQISSRALPSRMNTVEPAPQRFNSWERGVVTDRRIDGSQMPLINSKGHPIGVKSYAENRRRIDAARQRVREDPSILTRR